MNGILYFILSRLYVYDVMNPRIDDDIVLCWVWACMDLKEHNINYGLEYATTKAT